MFSMEDLKSIQSMISHLQVILNSLRLGAVSQHEVNDKLLRTLFVRWRAQETTLRTFKDIEAMP